MARFFLYARKSSEAEDRQVMSIEAQVVELRELAAREKIHIIEELIEKQSAKVPGRPIFNSMLDRIDRGEASGIISWHPDRLARNSVDGGRVIYLLDTGKLAALKFSTFWFESTPQGKFMLNIAFGQSKYYVDSLAENTKRGLRQKVRLGHCPGVAPVGYLNDSRTKTVSVDPVKAPLVAQAFQIYAQGDQRLEDIRYFLAKNSICSRTGKAIHIDRVKHLLTNVFYYGHFKYSGEIFEGKHKPIITKNLFDQVQQIMAKRANPHHLPKITKPYLGLICCGECGMMITAEVKKGHTYYRCTKKSKTVSCRQKYSREEEINKQISGLINKFHLPTLWAEAMLTKLTQEKNQLIQSAKQVSQDKRRQMEVVDNKLQLLLDSYLDQVVDRDTYLTKKSKLMSQRRSLQDYVISGARTQNAWLEPFRNWILEASQAQKVAEDNDKNRKKVLAEKIFGSNLTLTRQKLSGIALNPWSALCADPTTRNWERDRGVEPLISLWKSEVIPIN